MRSEFLIIFLSTLVLQEVSSSHSNNECTPVLKDNYKLGVEVKSMNETINKLLIEKRLGDVQIEIKENNINNQSAIILEQNKTIEKYKERLKDISNIIKFWDSQIKQKDKEIEDQKVLLQNKTGEIERNEELLDSKSIEILDKTENIKVLQRQIDDLRNSTNEEIEKKNENIQVLLQIKQNQTELLQENDYQIGEMTKTIAVLNDKLGIAKGNIKNLTEIGETLTQTLENLKKNKEIVDSKYKDLVNHSKLTDKTIEAKDAQISELNKTITDMQSSQDLANINIKQNVDLINAQNNEIIQIKRNQTELLRGKDYQIGEMTKTIAVLNDKLGIANGNTKNLTEIGETLTQTLENLKKNKEIVDSKYKELMNHSKLTDKTIEAKDAQISELNKTITDMQSSLDSANINIKQNVDLINAQNNEITQINRNQTERLRGKDYQIGEMTKTIEDLNENIDIKNNENKNLTEELKTLKEDLKDLRSKLQTAKHDVESKDKQIADLENRASSDSGQLVAVTNELRECNRGETCPRSGLYATHKLKLRGIETFEVPCNASGWMTIQRRYDGSVNFNRNWLEYKYGFGSIAGEFFIGLEKLYVLTAAQRYELSVKFGNFTTGRFGYAHYDNFQIGSENELYELKSLGKFTGSVEDILHDSVNQKFSTFDQFNGRYITNCASDGNGGWWYENCCKCSLNGKYHEIGNVEIMIRPV
ncbi:angiopoietin-2-like [Drosophila elegans]|uniref:angiopoietin-2-like n=1 Tax=Drosophila elegans TaxID=30023 RepID=UPI0007E5DFAA|nr:angiopoietin-2-like [Drosophila elegans]